MSWGISWKLVRDTDLTTLGSTTISVNAAPLKSREWNDRAYLVAVKPRTSEFQFKLLGTIRKTINGQARLCWAPFLIKPLDIGIAVSCIQIYVEGSSGCPDRTRFREWVIERARLYRLHIESCEQDHWATYHLEGDANEVNRIQTACLITTNPPVEVYDLN